MPAALVVLVLQLRFDAGDFGRREVIAARVQRERELRRGHGRCSRLVKCHNPQRGH